MSKTTKIIIGVVILLIAAAVGYYFWTKSKEKPAAPKPKSFDVGPLLDNEGVGRSGLGK